MMERKFCVFLIALIVVMIFNKNMVYGCAATSPGGSPSITDTTRALTTSTTPTTTSTSTTTTTPTTTSTSTTSTTTTTTTTPTTTTTTTPTTTTTTTPTTTSTTTTTTTTSTTTTTTTTPTTTTSTTTTTAAPTTTTTTVATGCATCSLATLTLDPGAGITPVAGAIVPVGGCNTVTVTCTADTAGFLIYMDFDMGANNPDINQVNPVAAMLTCNAAGNWEYMSNIAMQSYEITTISCFEFAP